MTFQRVVVILRHNTQLAGDARLACRELAHLMGSPGTKLTQRRDVIDAVEGLRVGAVPLLSDCKDYVALLWRSVSVESVRNVLTRSAFAQEVLLMGGRQELEEFCGQQPAARVCQELGGFVAVALATYYVIESEGTFVDQRRAGRIRRVVELLLQPYLTATRSQEAERLRGAKKTTLALSHDLHIYKAKFFPRMIRALLNIYGSAAQQVFDPYSGSGTALLEASLLGHDAVGVDIDPICQLIAKSKITPFLNSGGLARALDRFEEALGASGGSPETLVFPEELRAKLSRRDKIDGTTYLPEVQEQASRLAYAVSTVAKGSTARDLICVLASDAVTKKIRYRFIGVGNGRYTIEIVKQPLVERVREKIERCRQLAHVFGELRDELGVRYGQITVGDGDARSDNSWPSVGNGPLIVTSPPYLPASSGREHYAASRALAFAVLGFEAGRWGYFDSSVGGDMDFDLASFPEAQRLMSYLESDASVDADPQRDAMRFERKAQPTRQYLADIQKFFRSVQTVIQDTGLLLLVVANQHTFYSHRRSEVEHVVACNAMYSELARSVGLEANEEIPMELMKSAISQARPRATDDYFELVLAMQRASVARQRAVEFEQRAASRR